MEQESPVVMRKKLVRDVKREALERMEAAARTEGDFKNVVKQWDHLDKNRERRERYNEPLRAKPLAEWGIMPHHAIIPAPFGGHPFWRQHLRGHFLDLIYDCPHQLHEQTASVPVYHVVKELKEGRKEILYYRAIRLYSPQRIAALRGQTDRNIRKLYTELLADIRGELFEWFRARYEKPMPLTVRQAKFVIRYAAEHGITLDEAARKKETDTLYWLRSDCDKEVRDEQPVPTDKLPLGAVQ